MSDQIIVLKISTVSPMLINDASIRKKLIQIWIFLRMLIPAQARLLRAPVLPALLEFRNPFVRQPPLASFH